ncbi:aldehyde dehydrogenase [Rhodococcus pyridinivorans KG-16]|uniref:Aldehyde dehydrogenase n=1 Tax=Rhodococcus pyridinivorans KG-16 TaxID=1441730 RepID=A0A0V9UEN7_9NOCA|nr:aldehyde dehydrogenase [Rhodococcus pyridinivorans]KSZ56379.1 aldehyde dehydrogenase [Rhodococcus pyridinivorans KG-16]
MPHNHAALYIDGEWRTPTSSDVIEVHSASTEEKIGQVPECTPADVDAAVAAAGHAFRAWSAFTPVQRADVLERFAVALGNRAELSARLVSEQNGMPISIATVAEGQGPTALLSYYASLARATELEERRPALAGNGTTVVRKEPIGVVAAIAPWNFPALLAMMKIAPALAAGCTVVLKPSPETVLDSFVLAQAAVEAGLPAGVLNIVTGGPEIGKHLVAHPGVQKVAFTGSTPAGRQIAETCGRLLRPVSLELGGKSAALILDDADLAATVQGLATASLINTGQTCYASTRILAPQSRYAEVLDAVTAMVSSLPVGDPLDPDTFIGPLVSAGQRARVESYIEAGRSEGAKLTTGGGRPADRDRGWFVEPTVFGEVGLDHTIAREEIFGPVLSVIPYTDEEQAIAIANDSEFGLGGTVWTADTEHGLDVARRVETGSFGVNGYTLDFGAPFGGIKASGLGRELGPEGLASYFNTKSIFLTD